MKQFMIVLIATTTMLGATAQNKPTSGAGPVIPNNSGVWFFTSNGSNGSMQSLYKQINKSIIMQSADGSKFEEWFTITKPASYPEFEQRMGKAAAEECKKIAKAKSNDDMMRMLKDLSKETGLLFFNKYFLKAIGLIGYKETGKEKPVAYRCINVYNDGRKEEAYTILTKDIKASTFIRPQVKQTYASDSMAQLSWILPAGENDIYSAKVYRRTGLNGKFEAVDMPVLKTKTTTGETNFMYSEEVTPETFYSYYIVPLDFADNEGPASDTANVLSIANKKITSIQNLKAVDTLGSIVLSWKQLPQQGYYSGIVILKSRKPVTEFIIMDTIAASATSYADRNVVPGTHYYYQVRTIMYPFAGIKQLPSAMTNISSANKSQKPFRPQGLQAANEGEHIRLRWLPNPELDLYAYYVLRGTSAKNMEVIANNVQDTTWLDSSQTLTGQTTYVYALQVMNREQKLSDTSMPAYIKPARGVTLPNIGGLTSTVMGNRINLRWEDVASRNYNVTGYILLRREKGADKFMVLVNKMISTAFYSDTITDKKETVYEYAVAAMDAVGNIGNLSNSVFAGASMPKPAPPGAVYANAGKDGINISWAPVLTNDNSTVNYIIYRRIEGESSFTKLTTTGKTTFIDSTANKPGKLYSYAVTTVINSVEGIKSDVTSVRQK